VGAATHTSAHRRSGRLDGFALPTAPALVMFAYDVGALSDVSGADWPHGLKVVAIAVVAQAVFGMMRALAPDRERATMAVIAAIVALEAEALLRR
jgi:chromate transporter